WEIDLKPWDTAAGMVLIEEAGGKTSDFAGNEYSPTHNEIAASNAQLHDQLTALLSNKNN
ncbi:MAG: inositol monophosphatase, partial [Desulfobulbaceae bacterium]|nr:inositol monophosphatase [Desulfobulbaceae bacterium]